MPFESFVVLSAGLIVAIAGWYLSQPIKTKNKLKSNKNETKNQKQIWNN